MTELTQKPDWPTALDVEDLLTATGLFQGSLSGVLNALPREVEAERDAAIQMVQEWTGWTPFLAQVETRFFDPPGPDKGPAGFHAGRASQGGGRRLFLGGGLLSAATLKTGLTADNAVGETLTLGRDFWLKPTSAPAYRRPFTSVEFRCPQYGEPQSIEISGLWGFAAGLPLPVWQAVRKLAAAGIAPLVDLRVNKGRLSLKAGDEEERFSGGRDAGPVAAAAAQWREDADLLIQRGNYRRMTL